MAMDLEEGSKKPWGLGSQWMTSRGNSSASESEIQLLVRKDGSSPDVEEFTNRRSDDSPSQQSMSMASIGAAAGKLRSFLPRFGSVVSVSEAQPGDVVSAAGEPRVLKAAACLPQVIRLTVPLDSRPGDQIHVGGPSGVLKVKVPTDAIPGKPCNVSIRPSLDYAVDVTVPSYSKAGDPVFVTTPDGRQVHSKVPEDKGPGDTFKAFPDLMMVQVPAGVRDGDSLSFCTLDGRTLTVALPHLKPGEYFPSYL
mmetsp:Transcript_18581/g.41399  ORF Transcript_18581/g.41399 Transcript_18581/m.41399 type:complete len:252 (-) Transcript_18581:61-816(-)